jgi:hypothetical protein
VRVRRLVVTLMLAVVPCAALQGQSLRDQLSQLFIFGDGAEALFLGGSGDPNNPDAIERGLKLIEEIDAHAVMLVEPT